MRRCLCLAALTGLSLTTTQAAQDNPLSLPEWREPATGLHFVQIPAGCFAMGNPQALLPELDRQLLDAGYQGPRFADEAPEHQVCVDGFWIAKTELTAAQWQQISGSAPPKGQGTEPAAAISWQQAQAIAQQLSQQSPEGVLYRLPTEAEWEYACRAGTPDEPLIIFDDELLDRGWYSSRHRRLSSPAEVGLLAANAWGLQDMLGNVWEWTADNYSANAYLTHAFRNPRFTDNSRGRVIRGGSFRSNFKTLRCGRRSDYPQDSTLEQIGVRLVRSLIP